ncbi:hypothetical protein ACHAWF_004511, partial [Thalassiosira exigua]
DAIVVGGGGGGGGRAACEGSVHGDDSSDAAPWRDHVFSPLYNTRGVHMREVRASMSMTCSIGGAAYNGLIGGGHKEEEGVAVDADYGGAPRRRRFLGMIRLLVARCSKFRR